MGTQINNFRKNGFEMLRRMRRLRTTQNVRDLIKENSIGVNDLIAPIFILEGKGLKIPIKTMPGQFRYSLDLAIEESKKLEGLGIKGVALFPVIPDQMKDPIGSEGVNPNGFYLNAIRSMKKNIPSLVLMSDVALDPYSSHGHDGIYDPKRNYVNNDQSLEILQKMAILQAQAGADIIGPSDMMDGRVGVIRRGLDENGFTETIILSYTAKFASNFYGPFRDALDSAPKFGDKKTYQMDFSNSKEALREAKLDIEEGADILMVKPGLAYLDIISLLKRETGLPIAAYNVSGEYSMIKAAAQMGMINGTEAMIEVLTALKRAGSDIILTYFAGELAEILN